MDFRRRHAVGYLHLASRSRRRRRTNVFGSPAFLHLSGRLHGSVPHRARAMQVSGRGRPASTMRAMIVDVHTHAPRFKTKEEAARAQSPTERAPMRPDRPDPQGVTWDDYLAAMQFV